MILSKKELISLTKVFLRLLVRRNTNQVMRMVNQKEEGQEDLKK
jgi:hypothetical protein